MQEVNHYNFVVKNMADFEKMIPFILHFAAGVYGKDGKQLELPLEEQFILAKRTGWSDDKDDPGGATMIDVTLSTYTHYRISKGLKKTAKKDLLNISFEEWKEILKTMYWDKWQGDYIESQGIANLLVDWIWASGYMVIKKAQKIIGVKNDGGVGPETISAINGADSGELYKSVFAAREEHYRQCRAAWKYLNGWMRRLNAIQPDGTFRIYGKIIGTKKSDSLSQTSQSG